MRGWVELETTRMSENMTLAMRPGSTPTKRLMLEGAQAVVSGESACPEPSRGPATHVRMKVIQNWAMSFQAET